MAVPIYQRSSADNSSNTIAIKHRPIKCMQINLQHSRAAVNNLMQTIESCNLDLLFLQEPYIVNNKVAGISQKYQIFTSGDNRPRAAIIVVNKRIDAILIRQLSDDDAVTIELVDGNIRFYAVSMYMDITVDINNNLSKLDEILRYTKEAGVLIATDSNARSKTWYDVTTNDRGRAIEEYISLNRLYLMNEPSEYTTFESRRGKSNNDLTITNGKLAPKLEQWRCGEEESCSDHRSITFNINNLRTVHTELNFSGVKYIVKDDSLNKFTSNLIRALSSKIDKANISDTESLDKQLSKIVAEETNTEKLVSDFEEDLTAVCTMSFVTLNPTRKLLQHRTVPWWTEELTILRKMLK